MSRSTFNRGSNILWSLFFLIIYNTSGFAADPKSLFPEIPGWLLIGDKQSYQPDNLYEYINGAADLYLAYDFQELLIGEYRNDQQASVIIEIYRHGSAEQAFGIYSQERPMEGKYISIGAEGYVEGPMLNFISGLYYIKISGTDITGSPEEVIKSFAQVTARQIGLEPMLPEELSCFPEKDMEPHSEKYINRNFLGYEFLHSAFTADYRSKDQQYRLFIIKGLDENDCLQMMRALHGKSGQDIYNVEGRYRFNDPYSGKIWLEWRKNFIWGGIGLEDSSVFEEHLNLLGIRVKEKLLQE